LGKLLFNFAGRLGGSSSASFLPNFEGFLSLPQGLQSKPLAQPRAPFRPRSRWLDLD